MSNIWFTSDTHFGHANIIRFCDRPFKDIQEMNERLIANWNAVVRPGDSVYHMGDFSTDIGVDCWDYQPVHIDVLLDYMKGLDIIAHHD